MEFVDVPLFKIEHYMHTADQWPSMGKEALLLLANLLNIRKKGKSIPELNQLLIAQFDCTNSQAKVVFPKVKWKHI